MGQHFLNSKYAYLLTLKFISIIIATADNHLDVCLHSALLLHLILIGRKSYEKEKKKIEKGF